MGRSHWRLTYSSYKFSTVTRTEGGSLSTWGSRLGAAHIRLQKNTKSTRARTCQIYTNTTVLQAVQHKSLRNPWVFQYKMLQMFCPRALFEIIRKPFDFNMCVQITRSHLTSRYIPVGLACVQGMNSYQLIPYHAGHRNPYTTSVFLSSLR